MMGEAVEQGRREFFVAGKNGHPFGKGEIGRDDGRPSLVPIGDQIEEELAVTRANANSRLSQLHSVRSENPSKGHKKGHTGHSPIGAMSVSD